MNIAVTGGMGSGKSFVTEALAEMLGAEKISADLICRRLLEVGQPGHKLLRNHLSGDFFLIDGTLNRPFLRKAIFSDEKLRLQIDAFLHPLVRDVLLFQSREAKRKGLNLVVEVPLLFEKSWQGDYDVTLVVYADDAVCVQRIIARDKVTAEAACAGISCQMSLAEKCKLSKWVVDNSGTLDESLKQLEVFVRSINDIYVFAGDRKEG